MLENNTEIRNEKGIGELDDSKGNGIFSIIFVGFLTLLTITAVAILHSNQQEFILERFVGISKFKFSLFDATVYAAYFITGIIIGILSGKLAKRKIFIFIGSIGAALFFFLMTLTLNYFLLIFLRFVQGCFSIMVWQILMTIVLDLSTPNNRGRNMGIFGILLALGMGLGPFLGGFIADVGVFVPYYVASGLMVLVLFLSFFLKEPINLKKRVTVKESLNILKSDPKIIVPSLFNFIDRLHMGFIIFALPLMIGLDASEGGLALEPKYRGMAFGIFALPYILLQYPFGKLSDKIGRYPQLLIGSICYGVVLSFLGYFGGESFGVLLTILVILGLFSGVTSPPSMALVGDSLNDTKKNSAAMGLYTLLGNIGIALGPVIAGTLLQFGFGITFFAAGIIEVFFLMINLILIRFVFKEKLFRKNYSFS
jgi:MFS family permease